MKRRYDSSFLWPASIARLTFTLTAIVIALVTPPAAAQGKRRLVVSASTAGAEHSVMTRQVARYERQHPNVDVVIMPVPEGGDERHQLYVQWLNSGVPEPDVLQLDIVWLQEFAAAGWLRALSSIADPGDYFPSALESARHAGELFALPWFVDVGVLYYRKDWFERAPETFDELTEQSRRAQRELGAVHGFVFQGARYEGLTTVFLEVLGGFGGSILNQDGRSALSSEPALRALTWLRDAVAKHHISPSAVWSFQEEQARFEFQSGRAAFMRNWPYAYALMQNDPGSAVRDKVGIAPMPRTATGRPTAALGGQQLAINAHSAEPELARHFIEYLVQPEQMLERAELAAELPARRSVFGQARLGAALPFPTREILAIIEHATPRPPSPVYNELSAELQIELHRALTGQVTPDAALARASVQVDRIVEAAATPRGPAPVVSRSRTWWMAVLVLGACGAVILGVTRRSGSEPGQSRPGLIVALLAPTLLVVVVLALFPLAVALVDSLHHHDLRKPWLGRPFVGLSNYEQVLSSSRFWGAALRTLAFAVLSVAVELTIGLALALLLARSFVGRGLSRAAALLPWALPTVVVGLAFRFLFDARVGPLSILARAVGLLPPGLDWFSHEVLAWIPILIADVWKTTPFVALLLLSGLSGIPRAAYEAAAVDGAGPLRQLFAITLPILKPLLLLVLLLRTLDAVRIFDLIYVMTRGGPGVATEPIAVYTHQVLLQNLDFGMGAALSWIVFLLTLGVSAVWLRLSGARSAS